MKIFVTGATGSIGAHLVKMLSERGHTIHVLVRSLDKAKKLDFPGIVPFEGDILDPEAVGKAMAGCEQAYHLAAFAKVWAKETGVFYDINVRGTEVILQEALKHQIKRVVVTSTAGILGPSINGVIDEEKVRDIDIFNEYEGSKAMTESKIKDYVLRHDLDVVIVSPTRVYGPFLFGEPSSVTLMVDKYVTGSWRLYPGDGTKVGNYVYIEDVALGHILAMEKGKKGETYLLGGENYDYIQFYDALAKVSGVKRKMYKTPIWVQMGFAKFQLFKAKRFNKAPLIVPKWILKGHHDYELSPAKAIKELGLPVTPLEEGLKKTVEYCRNRLS